MNFNGIYSLKIDLIRNSYLDVPWIFLFLFPDPKALESVPRRDPRSTRRSTPKTPNSWSQPGAPLGLRKNLGEHGMIFNDFYNG